jgi:hypothetical protein
MTKTEVITFRSARSQRELGRKFGNVSRRLNELVEREFAGQPPRDWREILDRPAPPVDDRIYELCLKPE